MSKLSDSLEGLEALQKRSSTLDMDVKKGLRGIFPELAIDYDEIAHKAELGASFSALIDYEEGLKALKREAREIIKEGITGSAAEGIIEKVDYLTKSTAESIEAKEKLVKQIKGIGGNSERAFHVYSHSNLDGITSSYIEDESSTLRETLAKYKMDKLIISASCEGMLPNGEYDSVTLRYKTFASSYRRALLDDSQARRAEAMIKDGSMAEIATEHISDMDDMLGANVIPRLVKNGPMLELASETYYYEDYNAAVRKVQEAIMNDILQRL